MALVPVEFHPDARVYYSSQHHIILDIPTREYIVYLLHTMLFPLMVPPMTMQL